MKFYFSLKKYIELIIFFKNLDYKFKLFQDNIRPSKNIILRHDVDIDIDSALLIAKIEKGMRVKSTFFFLISSNLYNVLTYENQKKITEIKNMGHEIGLHFDFSIYQELDKNLINEKIVLQKNILENIIRKKIKTISIHRPGNIINLNKYKINSLINVYSKKFTKKINYFSDSKGNWKYGYPPNLKIFNKEKQSIQLLTHPIWWNSKKNLTNNSNATQLKFVLEKLFKKNFKYLSSYKKFK